MTPIFARRFICTVVLALSGCLPGNLLAINPLTGERRAFEKEEDVPEGWIVCASDDTCPAPRPCGDLDEGSCLARSDCSPVYVGIGAYPRECEEPEPPAICDGDAFAGCTDSAETCGTESCGPAPLGATWLCADGSIGGVTGRCVRAASGSCGWEVRECPTVVDECAVSECGPALGAPAYECPDGSIGGNTGRCLRSADGSCGWELRECPSGCESVPACGLACPPGTENPIDADGCAHTCECVPAECAEEECGPALGAPAYECPDGSIGGNTGRCLRTADGSCGWEQRECPGPSCEHLPMCDLACPPGSHNPVDADGCVHTCECVPD